MRFSDSAFGAIVTNKCPRCRKGHLYLNKNPYNLNKLAAMPKRCPSCGLLLEPEAGFYYGAMYLSYGIGVFSCLIVFALLNFIFKIDTTTSFVIIVIAWVGSSPLLFRFSRSLWLNIFVKKHRDI